MSGYGRLIATDKPKLRGIGELASLYGGIEYDRSKIEDVFQNATSKKYQELQNANKRATDQYYDRSAINQNSVLDAMRMGRVESQNTQGNQAVSDANMMTTMLANTQATAGDNLLLAQNQNVLDDKEQTEVAMNTREALAYSNEVKLGIGTLSANIYSSDVQKYAAQLGYNGMVQAANTTAWAMMASSAGSYRGSAADKNVTADLQWLWLHDPDAESRAFTWAKLQAETDK